MYLLDLRWAFVSMSDPMLGRILVGRCFISMETLALPVGYHAVHSTHPSARLAVGAALKGASCL